MAKATASTGFPEEVRRTLLVGLATTGRLGDSVGFPALPSGRTLQRDFFTLRVLDLRSYLLGTPAAAWDGTKIEPRPVVRRDETVTLLPDGNDVLGAAAAALAGSPTESLVVAQRIDGAFAVPTAAGATAHWPAFPPARRSDRCSGRRGAGGARRRGGGDGGVRDEYIDPAVARRGAVADRAARGSGGPRVQPALLGRGGGDPRRRRRCRG